MWLPNGNYFRTDLSVVLCPFVEGFLDFAFLLDRNAGHRSALMTCVCVCVCAKRLSLSNVIPCR